jgi:sigma-B regulation protein RsbU (phosphoserine phosphatase)
MKIPDSAAPRTLIADDQADVLDALRLLLKGEGYQIEAVSSPAAVIETLQQREFDVLLMDLNYARDTTSGREGLDLLPRIQAIDSSLPIVVMTAWSTVPLAVEAMRRGVSDFVQKPWENSHLLDMLRTQVERARSERLRRFLEELERQETQETERGLLPRRLPEVPGFGLAGTSRPVRGVGGDYFDVRELGEGKVALAIGDVIGKGVPAALLMSNLQAAVRAFAAPDLLPAALCEKVNRVVSNNVGVGKFITFFYCLLDVASRRLAYTNAGHTTPIVVRSDGSTIRLNRGGAALGVTYASDYEQDELELFSGDRVIWFTDGVTEAVNSEDQEFGEERLIDLLAEDRKLSAEELEKKVLARVSEFSGGSFQDDATLIVLCAE